ncbi:hypothetical protein F511_47006 [Dorcoceras hygrometricum]|uniref:Uncharacterized protein n=1 Tax=Dorcoceras hygrometricum TaxID=472368 RepID=A0A2Z6ZSN4_9LAMI|nr:hypothetical protein F511_47006 [Dorcoceras hygrometricum]
MGPISNTGPKTSRVARDRPEPNLRRNKLSRHHRSFAGAAADATKNMRRKAARGRTAARIAAQPAPSKRRRAASNQQVVGHHRANRAASARQEARHRAASGQSSSATRRPTPARRSGQDARSSRNGRARPALINA